MNRIESHVDDIITQSIQSESISGLTTENQDVASVESDTTDYAPYQLHIARGVLPDPLLWQSCRDVDNSGYDATYEWTSIYDNE